MKHIFAPFIVVVVLLSSAVACAQALDDFEEGVAAGWQGVGHGSADGYRISAVSPGYQSRYALRVTDLTQDGFCGAAINNLQKLKLRKNQAIHFSARNVHGATNIIVDVHCNDGTRWQQHFTLPADGEWATFRATPGEFWMAENPQNITTSGLDMSTASSLWLVSDKRAEAAEAPFEMEIDDVAFVDANAEGKVDTKNQPPAPKQPAKSEPVKDSDIEYNGVVGILDDGDFFPQTSQAGVSKAIAEVLSTSGVRAECIAPKDWVQQLDSGAFQTVILTGPRFPAEADKAILRHLKAGRSLWYISTAYPLSQPMQQAESGLWSPATQYAGSPEVFRILDGHVLNYHRIQLKDDEFILTPQSRAWWPTLPKNLLAENCGLLSANNSIYSHCAPPWVHVTPLLEVRYEDRNWIYRNDTFTGWVAAIFSHRAGPFRGAKILFMGLGFGKDKLLDPANPRFTQMVLSSLRELNTPVKDLWLSDPTPPASKLTEVPRSEWFTSPEPIFASINFDGIPSNDPTFWDNQQLAGFNTVYTEIPFLLSPNAQGEVIDWAKADQYVSMAKEHKQVLAFDAYSISHWQWQWAGDLTVHNPEFLQRFSEAMAKFALRYKNEPAVKALFILPLPISYGTLQVDSSAQGRAAWIAYVRDTLKLSLPEAQKRYNQSFAKWDDLPLPEHRPEDRFNLSPLWSDYLDFFLQAHQHFIRTTIQAIRQSVPDMPIYLRGPFLDVAMHMSVASEFDNVAPHCECIETSLDVEGYYRSLGQTFGVPISAENGWPKSKGGPLRMALASYFMGGYRSYFYSFGGPLFTRPNILEFHKAEALSIPLKKASYAKSDIALLIPDTTMYASTPPTFMSIEGLPHIEYAMERSGFAFRGVSTQFPKLDGLKYIIDDGTNYVFTTPLRHALTEWVRQGGTLFVFPETGQFDLSGKQETLAGALGISFDLPKQKNHMVHRVGQGRVVVLSRQLLAGFYVDAKRWALLEKLLENFGATREVRVTPRINAACFHDDHKTYIVLANKTPYYVGAYFTESTLSTAENSLPDLNLQVRPFFPFTEVRDLRTGKILTNNDGVISVPLPKTQYTILECTTP